jgi:hypothetical protein
MTREIANKPHPTPSPEGPHATGSIRGTTGASGETLLPIEDVSAGLPIYDTYVDDLDLILSRPVAELDPALRSKSSSDTLVSHGGSSSSDDHLAEGRMYWALIGLMCYSSVVTLALTWVLWMGRGFRQGDGAAAGTDQTATESAPKLVETRPVVELAPLPSGNLAKLGETVRIGELDVTPVEVFTAPVEMFRSIEPHDWRREETDSIILRLRLTNVSSNQAFAPLERAFVRDQSSPLDRRSRRATARPLVFSRLPSIANGRSPARTSRF